MNIKVEQLPECRAIMSVTIPTNIVAEERGKLVARFAQQAKIPGYRPGKVPATVIERKFKTQIEEEMKETLVKRGYDEGVEKENLDVLGLLDVSESDFNDDGTFSFTANLTMAPQFEMPEYKGVAVKLPDLQITDELVEENRARLHERYAVFNEEENKDRKVAMGDFVVINFQGNIGDQVVTTAIEGAAPLLDGRENFWIQTGPDRFLPGFCEGLLGMKAGDKRTIEIELPADFADEKLQGKTLTYDIELASIQNRSLPEWNDELANKVEEGATAEQVVEKIRSSLGFEVNRQLDSLKTNQIIAWLDKTLDIELPVDLVNHEAQRRLVDIAQRAKAKGISQEQLLSQQAEIEQNATAQARLNVKARFFLAEIAHKEEITVSNDDMSRAIVAMAQQSKQEPQKVANDLQKNNGFMILQNDIMIQKALELIKENVVVETVSVEDFNAFAKENALNEGGEMEEEEDNVSLATA